ncbi:glucose/galactose MFS transporter [Novosphingobium sp.]|uniref:glucose/galactose MFS transporter n=1 Tax=Novosphingobium sp. TaxID=1874826 RepID=UPI0035AEA0BC
MKRLNDLGIGGAFIAITTLFLVWGFIASNNDPLIMALRAVFRLNYTEGLAIQLVSFAAFGVMSLPAAALGNRLGAVRAVELGLAVMLGGCLLVRLALTVESYLAVLAALFVLACGINVLQVAANPLAAALGPARSSHFRLSFAQAFNSLGVVMGAHFGSRIMLGDKVMTAQQGALIDAAQRADVLGAVGQAYGVMAVLIAVLALFVVAMRPRIAVAAAALAPTPNASALAALRSRWAIAGAVGIGLYVGAEVSIGSIMIAFLHQPQVLDLALAESGHYLANLYWGGALVGRFIGAALLTRIPAPRLLAFCAGSATVLCLVAFGTEGALAGYAALAVGLFNSIMFPTIFSLTLERSGVSESSTSGLLCLAIAGGALLPFLVGRLADTASLAAAFAVPAIAYGAIAVFAIRARIPHGASS